MTDYPPVDVSKLVDHVIGDSSSDYDDGLGGISSGVFDAETGILTLKYERDEELQDPALNEQYGYVYSSAEYRFQLIPDDSGDVSDGFHTFKELYQYRLLYNAALFNAWTESHLYGHGGPFAVHKSRKHSDGEPCFGGGWFVVVAQLPTGQISNHYRDADWDLFRIPERETAAEWDGHTPAIAADRLLRFLSSPF